MYPNKSLPAICALLCLSIFNASADTIEPKPNSAKIYLTAKDNPQPITLSQPVSFSTAVQPLESEIAIFVNPQKTYQTIFGFGGAITDASAEVFAKLPANKQSEFLKAYYNSTDGIGYTIARTTIHSSDFSSESYTYVKEGDKNLSSFNIKHDLKYKIPLLKKANAETHDQLKLFASPWSPPAYMKSTNNMLHGGKLLPEYQDLWSLYFVKFIQSYEKAGVPIWGVSIQNEPMANQIWESLIITAEEERDFLKLHLGPNLEKAGLADKKIIIWDHNRDLLPQRVSTILNDPDAAKYVWGIGYHWYETWAGGEPMHKNVSEVYQTFPDKNLLLTESTIENFDFNKLQHWPNGEKYAENMINDFNAGTVGWTDWNILLDEQGGPNHVKNFCFAPIHANTKTGELIYTPIYYYIGHFSKFVKPNAVRISSATSRSSLNAVSFLNPDKTIATIVLNKTDKNIDYSLYVANQQLKINIPAHAIQTLIY